MKTINENETLQNFNAWSGAVETKKAIIDADKAEEFEQLIEELYPDGLTNTTLNDLLWFDSEFIFESLGITEEEEEEEETEEEE
jgi:hypothetical protein